MANDKNSKRVDSPWLKNVPTNGRPLPRVPIIHKEPDYELWTKMDKWSLSEAICLLSNVDPFINSKILNRIVYEDRFEWDEKAVKIFKLYQIASRTDWYAVPGVQDVKGTDLLIEFPPHIFLSWAKMKGLPIPPVLDLEDATPDMKDQTHENVVVFYKVVDGWMIGLKGKAERFKDLIGFERLHYLLMHRRKAVSSIDLYYKGNPPGEIKGLEYSAYQKIGGLSKGKKSNLSEYLEEKLNVTTEDGLQRIEIKEKIDILKKYQNEGGHAFKISDLEKARVNCRKSLKTAIDKIVTEKPELKDYFSLGKNREVDTSNGTFTYRNINSTRFILEKP